MSGVDHLRKSVPFPLAGEGACLRFTMHDTLVLRGQYDRPANQPVKRDEFGNAKDFFWQKVFDRVSIRDPQTITDCLIHGLKQADGITPIKPDLKVMDFNWADCVDPILDALSLSQNGKTFKELRDLLEEAAKDGPFAEGESPLTDLISGSDASGSGSEPV